MTEMINCHQDTEIRVSGCNVLPERKETKLGSINQKAFPSAAKNAGVVLVPCCSWKRVHTTFLGGVDIPEVPGYHLL